MTRAAKNLTTPQKMTRRALLAALLLLLAALTAGAKKPAKKAAPAIYPTREAGWHAAEPEKYGFDSAKLEDVRKFIINKTNATGVEIIVGGEEIFQYGAVTRLSYIASCRKSILAMLYGKYVENGTIDLKKTVGDLGIDDVQGLLPIEKKATVYDLITARSGVFHPASNAGDDTENKPTRGTKKPGQFYLYNNWDFNAAGTAFEMMTGKNIYDAFGEDIAIPIGMQDWNRDAQRKGGNLKTSIHPAYHFFFSTRDMARLGYLMLRKGRWEDRQVISEDWVRKMTTPVSTAREVSHGKEDGRYSYGYMWWIYDEGCSQFTWEYEGAYAAHGSMGQYIKVFPALDMVVAIKTDSVYGRRTSGSAANDLIDLIVKCYNPKLLKQKK